MRKTFYGLLAAVILICICAIYIGFGKGKQAWIQEGKVIVIDAGHGGIDGGAVGKNGLLEKDVNLSVAVKSNLIFNLLGLNTIMTRESDMALDDGSGKTIAARKAADIKRRVAIANASNGILISIHMNSFPEEKYWGAQCFYAKTNGSKKLGELIQNRLKEIEPKNIRQAKPVDGEIYLLKNVTIPALIVECGFLSNYSEAEKLSNDNYRLKLALCICIGAIDNVEAL